MQSNNSVKPVRNSGISSTVSSSSPAARGWHLVSSGMRKKLSHIWSSIFLPQICSLRQCLQPTLWLVQLLRMQIFIWIYSTYIFISKCKMLYQNASSQSLTKGTLITLLLPFQIWIFSFTPMCMLPYQCYFFKRRSQTWLSLSKISDRRWQVLKLSAATLERLEWSCRFGILMFAYERWIILEEQT